MEAANLVDVIGYLIAGIDRTMVVENTIGIRVFVCDTKYVTKGKTITLDPGGAKYKVIDFLEDEWMDLEPASGSPALQIGDTLLAPEITYLHGTPASVNNEYLSVKARQSKKTPFIWLLESYEEEEPGGDSSIQAIYRFRLFFMEGQVEEQSNDKHNTNAIKPMRNLSELFEEQIREDYSFKTPTDITRKPRSRFGVEITNQGNNRKIIDAALSGIELSMALEAFDTSQCKC